MGMQEGNHFAWENRHSCFHTATVKMMLIAYELQFRQSDQEKVKNEEDSDIDKYWNRDLPLSLNSKVPVVEMFLNC